jgi:uncharacterized protein (DUF433 family)
MSWQNHIEQRPGVMAGKTVIKGTRITVELILERLGAGWTEAQLLESYPHLTLEQIRACLTYAAHALASDETVFLAQSPA